jgi:aspartyl protease family protein
MGRISIALIVVVLAGAIGFAFRDQIAGLGPSQTASLVYMILLLILVSGGMAAAARTRPASHMVRNAALWALILFGAMGVYLVRDRLGVAFHPGRPVSADAGVEIRRADDGHFWADVEINGVPVRMLIDTGASACALSRRDAARVGIDVGALKYGVRISTAEGEANAAPASLEEVRVGDIRLANIDALIMDTGDVDSALGMSFLNRLGGYDVRGDRLVLHPAA